MIHIVKDIYKISRSKQFYALISIKQPEENPKSLVFSIADGYTTLGAPNASLYDNEVQQEMEIIISILNKMFDENNIEFYVGKKYNKYTNQLPKLYPIHNITNNVLTNMNKHTDVFARKNKGVMMNPILNNVLPIATYRRLSGTISKSKNKHGTRKVKKAHI